jgi:hypothetical protein
MIIGGDRETRRQGDKTILLIIVRRYVRLSTACQESTTPS